MNLEKRQVAITVNRQLFALFFSLGLLAGCDVVTETTTTKRHFVSISFKGSQGQTTKYSLIFESESRIVEVEKGGQPTVTYDVDQLQQACDDGDAVSCHHLGLASFYSARILQNGAAETPSRLLCEEEDCPEPKVTYLDAFRDYVHRSVTSFKQACDAEETQSCNDLVGMYGSGMYDEEDDAELFNYAQKACNGGHAPGCFELGLAYVSGRGVEQDFVGAASSFEQACKGGVVLGCLNLGISYENGRGVEQDFGKAALFHEQACNGGYTAGCNNLGVFYETGRGVEQDSGKAAALYGQACDGGEALGCDNLKRIQPQ